MPLILAPTFDTQTRAQIEAHLGVIRTARMSLAVQYHAGEQARLQHEAASVDKKLAKQYELLQKDLIKLEQLDNRCEERLAKCAALLEELGLVIDLIEVRTQHPAEQEG